LPAAAFAPRIFVESAAMDSLDRDARHAHMAKIGPKGSRLEMAVRRTLHRLGYRYRLHRRDLPGTPDIVFGPRRKVIFVHGCWWHGHDCKLGRRPPKSNVEFWTTKLRRNAERDVEVLARLQAMGWSALAIWECELGDMEVLEARLREFLDPRTG
jgi:DNA mismatch endonuclease, patch repair protein